MIENINTSVPKVVDNANLQQSATVVTQILIDSFLYANEGYTMKEILASKNLENAPGKLYNYHFMILQIMFEQELKLLGLDLKTEVEKTGATYVSGELSDLENELLANKINLISGVLALVEKNVNKN